MSDPTGKSTLRGIAERDGEPWYWTGNERTDQCGCTYSELAATDGHCEPIWMGKGGGVCGAHRERMVQRVRQLQAEGKLPNV